MVDFNSDEKLLFRHKALFKKNQSYGTIIITNQRFYFKPDNEREAVEISLVWANIVKDSHSPVSNPITMLKLTTTISSDAYIFELIGSTDLKVQQDYLKRAIKECINPKGISTKVPLLAAHADHQQRVILFGEHERR